MTGWLFNRSAFLKFRHTRFPRLLVAALALMALPLCLPAGARTHNRIKPPCRSGAAPMTLQQSPAVVLTAGPNRTINAGQSTTFTIKIYRTNYPAGVTLSVKGLPAGATAYFSPNPAMDIGSTLTVNTNANTTAGKWTLTVSGTGSGISIAPVSVGLTVYPAPRVWL